MRKSTRELLDILSETKDIKSYIKANEEELTKGTLQEKLEELLEASGYSKSECIKAAGIDRTYGYQIFAGSKRPSRDKLLQICLALKAGVERTHSILCSAEYADLYPRIERDSIILFALARDISLSQTNELLFEMKQEVLE